MMFLIVNAVVTAILFLIVVLPMLYIYNPDLYPNEPNGPPSAGEVIPDEDVTHAVKQKLYLLYVIPTCAIVNALFLYFAYYRPIRHIHYRVELNLLTLRLTLEGGRQQLQKRGILVLGSLNRSFSGVASGTGGLTGNASMSASQRMFRGTGRRLHFEGKERSETALKNSVNWEWRRRARPKNVLKDAWVNSAVFAEISELRDVVEQQFLLEGSVADANFAKAVVKTAGVFVPNAAAGVYPGQPRSAPPAQSASTNDFYISSMPPLMTLGTRISGGNNNNAVSNIGLIPSQHPETSPQRANSVVMVPVESPNRRNPPSGDSNINSASGGHSSALRFFKGGSFRNDSSSGHRGYAAGHTYAPGSGNRLEHPNTSPPTPEFEPRGSHEPVEVDTYSRQEPVASEHGTAVAVAGPPSSSSPTGGGGDGVAGASFSKPSAWDRLWHRSGTKPATA